MGEMVWSQIQCIPTWLKKFRIIWALGSVYMGNIYLIINTYVFEGYRRKMVVVHFCKLFRGAKKKFYLILLQQYT
jgi:hypothetical protein